MTILNRSQVFPQFRCLPLVGKSASYRYVSNLHGTQKTITHAELKRAVGEFNSKSRKAGG